VLLQLPNKKVLKTICKPESIHKGQLKISGYGWQPTNVVKVTNSECLTGYQFLCFFSISSLLSSTEYDSAGNAPASPPSSITTERNTPSFSLPSRGRSISSTQANNQSFEIRQRDSFWFCVAHQDQLLAEVVSLSIFTLSTNKFHDIHSSFCLRVLTNEIV
jgi:hypothetical protein